MPPIMPPLKIITQYHSISQVESATEIRTDVSKLHEEVAEIKKQMALLAPVREGQYPSEEFEILKYDVGKVGGAL